MFANDDDHNIVGILLDSLRPTSHSALQLKYMDHLHMKGSKGVPNNSIILVDCS